MLAVSRTGIQSACSFSYSREKMEKQYTGVTNLGFSNDEPKRKVSISNEAIQADEERERKLSEHRSSFRQGGDRQRKAPIPVLQVEDERYRKLSSVSTNNLGSSLKQNPSGAVDNGGEQELTATTSSKLGQGELPSDQPSHQVILDHLNEKPNKTDVSWWYLLCAKCRQKETGPGWEPGFWQNLCPYPFCPTYRYIARCVSLLLVIMLTWGVVYSVVGEDAAPGGQLFDIAMLVFFAHIGGYVFRMCNLPGLVGMLVVGVIYQNTGFIHIHGPYLKFCAILRRIGLVIILTRAGLDLDPGVMRRLFATILKIGLLPWTVEAGVVAVFSNFFLQMPWMWCLLLGSIVGAVSPAVVVPGLMRLRAKGYGVAKGIPTIVIAISGIDDAASVAAFGIIQSLMFSEHSLLYNIALGPVSVFGGIGFGVLWGLILKYFPEKGDPFVVPLRILMLLGGGMIAVFGSELVHLEGAGPLAVVAAAFVSIWIWSTQGWDIEDNPVATAFEIFWMVFEPILFSLTGTQIRIHEINPDVFLIALVGLTSAAILRILATVLVAFGGSLNMREKWFISFSCMAKASVQAALGPVVLDTVLRLGKGDGPERGYADTVLMVCVLSIVLTAPTGAIVIYFSGPRLLTKTQPGLPARLVRPRPSLRDITVVDEGKESDDIERRPSHSSLHVRETKQPRPSVIVTEQL